jgi:hypothetical protein
MKQKRWDRWHIWNVWMNEKRNAYRFLVRKYEGKSPYDWHEHTWEGNIQTDLKTVVEWVWTVLIWLRMGISGRLWSSWMTAPKELVCFVELVTFGSRREWTQVLGVQVRKHECHITDNSWEGIHSGSSCCADGREGICVHAFPNSDFSPLYAIVSL